MAVQISENPVGGDKIFRFFISGDDVALHFHKAPGALGDKAGIVQHLMRIGGIGIRFSGGVHLLPVGIRLVPESGSPGIVQRVQRSILIFEKFPEGGVIAFRIEHVLLTVHFIVDLPADDTAAAPVVRSGFLGDPRGQLPVYRRIIVIMPAGAVIIPISVHIRVQHFRILFRKPGRRRGGGRTEDHFHAFFLRQIQEPVEEVIVKNSLLRFHLVPGKFRDPDHFNTGLQHPPKVISPQLLGPVFRIIACPQNQPISF